MASNVSTIDGMGFEEVNQASATDMISGTNIYGTNISGGQVRFEDVVVHDSLTANVVSVDEGQLFSLSVGSGTPVYGAKQQAGSGVLASNDAWIVFPIAYNTTPIIITQNYTALDSELLLSLGSLNAGSFHMTGTNASDEFGWMAVGV